MLIGKAILTGAIAIFLAVSHAAAAADRIVVEVTQAEIGFDQRTNEPVVSSG